MTQPDEHSALVPRAAPRSPAGEVETVDWRHPTNASVFFPSFDARTFSSLEEMRASMLEAWCPGDGVLSGALSLITTSATPSMLALPLAFLIGGWWFAAASTVFCILMTFLSVRILALASVSADSDDYETVAGFFLGAKGRWTARSILFLYNLGSAVVYLSFIKDSITPILVGRATFLPDWLRGSNGGTVFLVLSMFVITPLTFNSRLASLRTKGFISNLITVFIISAIIYRYYVPLAGDERGGAAATTQAPEATHPNGRHAGRGVTAAALLPYMFVAPIFVFSYEVQSNVMAVIKDLHDRTGQRILLSITLALLVVTFFYVTLGIYGSLSFPHLASGNILSVYRAEDDLLITLCQLLCCFSAAISYVFCIFPCRQAAYMFVSNTHVDGATTTAAATGTNPTKVPKKMRIKLGIALSTIAMLCAVVLPDVAVVVSFLGALFSSTLSMTFPGLFALYMHHSGTYFTGATDLVLSWILLMLGVLFSVSGTMLSFFYS